MKDASTKITHAQMALVLRRAGIPPDTIEKIQQQLPDPSELSAVRPVLERHGITRSGLIERMGGNG